MKYDIEDAREGKIMNAVVVFDAFTRTLTQRNSGRTARGDHPLRYDPYRGQGRILVALSKEDNINQTQLAERLNITPQTLGIALRKLEAQGLISRSSGEQDKRTRLIRLTEEGREEKELLDIRSKYSGSMFEALDDDEIDQIIVLLKKLTAHMKREIEVSE